jgi:hypothetical protein
MSRFDYTPLPVKGTEFLFTGIKYTVIDYSPDRTLVICSFVSRDGKYNEHKYLRSVVNAAIHAHRKTISK